ncbi:holo-ACP synthase [Bifidobacterium cebidarum]|uniref:Holo-[acyl-carrier-protein] synthase n=1 Tax=Bifidobacterium cebidarum TaxID=2650773 RepID=A0A6I1GFQ8_9BIFI|nr:4'-phosphopantetheinyl transferase superfamily protein [Bifidobacterium cebidarum]KAB7788219.1 Holo-[acyl-carrier protein] synthase, belongs to 4-phosphopantetheinyl transferase superfamily [Bifidobacterium cebidarum]
MNTYGLGHDVVDVAAFAEQLAEPGSHMRSLFSVRELRQAAERARLKNDGEAVHLAAKWAGKEAFLKAWCEALGERSYPFTLDNFPWREVEVLDDSRGVPHVMLSGVVARAFRELTVDCGGSSRDDVRNPKSDYANDGDIVSNSVSQTDYAGSIPVIHISLSHDGPIASAVVALAD